MSYYNELDEALSPVLDEEKCIIDHGTAGDIIGDFFNNNKLKYSTFWNYMAVKEEHCVTALSIAWIDEQELFLTSY